MSSMIHSLIFTALLFSACAFVADGEEGPDHVEFTTQKVVVFKDGYALFIKKCKGMTDSKGEIHTEEVPDAAVLGTFWATSESGPILGMRAGWREHTETEKTESSALDNLSILRVNVGSSCSLVLNSGEEYSGVIREVLVEEKEIQNSAENPLAHQVRAVSRAVFLDPPEENVTTVTKTVTGSHFIIRTKSGDLLLPADSVRSLFIPEMKTKVVTEVVRKTRKKELSFMFKEKGKEKEITLMYFRPGLRWIPTYSINLSPNKNGKSAEVSLQAELLNEAEELDSVPIDIVVGVPNFRFKQTPSPLALESVMRNALARSEPVLMSQSRSNFSNATYNIRAGERRRDDSVNQDDNFKLPEDLKAGGSEDLFIYNLSAIRLAKGDRAAVSIFQADIPYRDVYTWDPHLKRDDIATSPSGPGVESPLKLSKNKIWHQIELTNTTKVPWTTGSAMIMKGQQPLAQELLTYTSPKDLCRVPVTISVETSSTFSEKELGRNLRALTLERNVYAKIDSEVSLSLCNHKSAAVDIEVIFKLGGRVSEASDKGQIVLMPFSAEDWNNYRGSPGVNNRSQVKWKSSLGPGEIFAPTVKYSFYSRQ